AIQVTINPPPTAPGPPTANATSPATCTDLTGTITVSAPAPAAGITYSIDGVTYTNTTGVFTGVAPGTYNVTFNNGACISAAAQVTINPPPAAPTAPVVGAITQPTCAVATGSVVLSGLPAGNWTINPGGITGTGASTTINGLAPGTYNYTVTNAAGCTSAASADVVINPQPTIPAAPTANATSPATCADLTGTITVTAPAPAAGITYSIDGVTYTNTTGVFTGIGPGTYNVTFDNGTCISAAAQVTINPPPTAPTAPVVGATSPATCTDPTGT